MTSTNKSLTVKKWFADKVAQEVKANINLCQVFGILKETEKAVYAILNIGGNFSKTMWIPKSVLVENEIGENTNGSYNHETYRFDSYKEAMTAFYDMWELYI